MAITLIQAARQAVPKMGGSSIKRSLAVITMDRKISTSTARSQVFNEKIERKDKKVLVVTGGTGSLGSAQIKKGLQDRSYSRVVAIGSGHSHLPEDSRLVPVDRATRDFQDQLKRSLEGAQEVDIINTVGGTPKGVKKGYSAEDLAKVNSEAVIPLVKKIAGAAETQKVRKLAIVNFCSIAASMIHSKSCLYAAERKKTREMVADFFDQYQSRTGIVTQQANLGLGFVMDDPKRNDEGILELDTGYGFSPGELSHFPFIPVFGNGKQTTQPVHIDDVTTGALNILSSVNPQFLGKLDVNIDAVTSNNQMPLLEFLAQFHPKFQDPSSKLYSLHIPYELATALTSFIQTGHLQRYAIEFCKAQDQLKALGQSDSLDPTVFEGLLGRKGIDIQERIQAIAQTEEVTFPKPKITEMMGKAIEHAVTNPMAFLELFRVFMTSVSGVEIRDINKS